MARILVVDDDPDIRALLDTTLRLAGHDVVLAADGVECLERQALRPADAVVIDIFMPEKEGLETIMELRQRYPRLVIVAMSGGGRMGNQTFLDQALHLGATRAISKPFDHHAIVSVLNDAMKDVATRQPPP